MAVTRKMVLAATLLATSFGADSARELIVSKCLGCHGDGSRMGGLSLATRKAMLAGGKRGPALIPGKPAESLLIQMISGGTPRMPLQGEPLTREQIATLRAWIEHGAEWSDGEVWWSLRPLIRPPTPLNSGTPQNPIDAFLRAKLREKHLTPSAPADRRTLIRRLTYDLHGLPPDPSAVESFVADPSPAAYEKLVDALLASPRYGERWGRHWLDVAHYGESHGYDKDKPRRNAWPYRDYVIRAFNQDKPYARFVEEQLAGDYLYPGNPETLVALGFIAAGPWDFVGQVELREDTTDKRITRVLDRDDMVTATMSSFVSMTAHCARCHNHKFDPIPQAEYYGLQAVFSGVDRADRPFDEDSETYSRRLALIRKRRDALSALRPREEAAAQVSTPQIIQIDELLRQLREVSSGDPARRPGEIKQQIVDAESKRKLLVRAALPATTTAEMDRLSAAVAGVDKEVAALPKPRWVYAAANYFEPQGTFRFAIEPRPVHVLLRGSVETPGAVAQPGALSCVPGLNARFNLPPSLPEGARRAALAAWITSPDNVLTWRSIVNRVWHYHFGAGLVDTPNDFGNMGSLPTHPELLDWLATEFRDSGGSMKRLHKLLVMSAAYQQSSQDNPENASIDSDNRFLWRANRQRLDAESLRDSLLAVSGKLNLQMGGPSAEQFYFKDDHSPVYDYSKFDVDAPGSYRRAVYRFIVRSVPDPLMERFDCPDVSMITAKRNTTITAIQALAQLNNPFVLSQSQHLAERITAAGKEPIHEAFRLTLQRSPTSQELKEFSEYLARHGLLNACRVLLNSSEFLFVD